MNETRRKPTSGRQSPSLSDKWHGIFYMPSRIDTAVHTKAFDYSVAEHWGENRNVQPHKDSNQQHIGSQSNAPGQGQGITYTAGQSHIHSSHTQLDIPRPLFTQSHRHSWTYQGLCLPSHTDTAGHTKAFDYPVTDTAGHTKAFDYPVTQTRLDIPRPLITQSHRHSWTYQGLCLPSHTDTAGHTKAFDYPVTDTAGHTKAFDYPVTQTRLDIPRPLITQSHRHGWTYQGL